MEMLPSFRVLNPTTVVEAVGELARLGDQARVYGGGTELLVLLRHKLVQTDHLLNIKPIAALSGIRRQGDVVSIGATVTHRDLETDPLVRENLPMLAQAESQVANIRVRSQGTLGGNLCFNDPHSDPATALLVYDASVTVHGSGGKRTMLLSEFLVGLYATALEPDELLVEVNVPRLPAGFGSAYLRIHRLQRPTLGVAAAGRLEKGRIGEIRLAVGCVGPKAQRLTDLESKMRGVTVGEAGRVIGEAKPYLKALLDPMDDLLGSAEYKLYLTGVLLKRALTQALDTHFGSENGNNPGQSQH